MSLKEKETCPRPDMAVPTDNKSLKEFNKINKYVNPEIEIEKMWHPETITVLVILGAQGMIKKETQEHINKIPGSPMLYEIQTIAICGTAHLLRRVLS